MFGSNIRPEKCKNSGVQYVVLPKLALNPNTVMYLNCSTTFLICRQKMILGKNSKLFWGLRFTVKLAHFACYYLAQNHCRITLGFLSVAAVPLEHQ